MPRIGAVSSVLVVTAYRFVDLDDGPALQAKWAASAAGAALKGTLLVAPEGINFSLAGATDVLDDWLDVLQKDRRFAGLDQKRHVAPVAPFGRLRVRFKREIIRMDQPAVRPAVGRAPSVDAVTLRRWLDRGHCDAGRPLVMLDTRNDFEVDAGAFDGALDWQLQRFSQFPQALRAQHASAAWQDRGQLLHRRHPLRKGRAVDVRARRAACAAARRRHLALSAGTPRRGALARKLFCLRRPGAAESCSGSCRRLMGLLVRVFGVLLMLTALAVVLSRAPDRPVQTLVARWAPPPSDFIEFKGQLVHYRDEGPRSDPLPILLIHGTASSLHTWEGWVHALKSQRRVVTFDLPGFGLTGPFTGQYTANDYRGDTYARFVFDLMDALALPRAVVGGNSLGGEVAWRMASLAPDRVAALILVDAVGPAFEPKSVPIGFRMAMVPGAGVITEWLLPRSVVADSVADVYGDPSKVTPELVDRYFELMLREGNRHALRMRLQQQVNGADADRIAVLKQPTLILWGGLDRLVPPAIGAQFQQLIKGSQRVVFDNLGHVPQEEDAARSVLPVAAFLGLK